MELLFLNMGKSELILVLWFLIILSIPLLGSIAYWFMGRHFGR